MEIKVLQGLNNQNPGTTIVIELAEKIPTKLLDKIQGFHPVFMDGYKLEDKTLTVNSKLGHLWVEIGKALQKMSSRDWSEDYAEKYILEEIIKRQVLSMSTIPVLYAAMQQGHEITQFYVREGLIKSLLTNRRYTIGCGAESQITSSSSSSLDSYIGFATQREKVLSNMVLDRLGIMSPKWIEVASKEEIKDNWESFKKPVVIKPNGLTGGNGVVTNIDTIEKAYHAFEFANEMVEAKERRPYQKIIIMQEQISGEDYRLLVINNKLEIATKRIPANVTGDGVHTIEELIDITNSDPRRDTSNPAHILKPIVKEQTLTDFLSEQGLTLSFIPKKNQIVYVRKVASMSKGGITEDFTEKVHPQIKAIVESLAASLHVYTLGIDVFCKDISKPLTPENGAILECNTMPEAYLNSYPVIGKQYTNIGDLFLNGLIGKVRTKRAVYIGKSLKDVQTNLKLQFDTKEERVGIYSQGKLYINEELINDKIDIVSAFEALKLNASLTTIVHHLTEKELEVHGSGFERLDLFVTPKDNEEVKKTFKGYENIGLIYKVDTF